MSATQKLSEIRYRVDHGGIHGFRAADEKDAAALLRMLDAALNGLRHYAEQDIGGVARTVIREIES
jgi:hypothetical protein